MDNFDPYRIPILNQCSRLHAGLFPPTLEAACECAAVLSVKHGGPLRTVKPTRMVFGLLPRLRTVRDIDTWRMNTASLHELLSLWMWSHQFQSELARLPADSSEYERRKKALSLKATGLTYFRVVVRSRVHGLKLS